MSFKKKAMTNPVQVTINQADGSIRKIIIEPVLKKSETGELVAIGIFKLYKDAFGDETTLFTEPLEGDKPNTAVSDDSNPDYLGTFTLIDGGWQYNGNLLGPDEQEQVANYIL